MSGKEIWTAVRNSLRALRKGEFLLRIRADKLYLHILYLFVLAWLTIMVSLKVDKTLTREGQNKAALEQLKIHHAEKEADIVRIQSASATEKRLQEMGSELRRPVQPAKRTGKK